MLLWSYMQIKLVVVVVVVTLLLLLLLYYLIIIVTTFRGHLQTKTKEESFATFKFRDLAEKLCKEELKFAKNFPMLFHIVSF